MSQFDPRSALRRGGDWIDRSTEYSRRLARTRTRKWRARATFIAQSAVAAGIAYFLAGNVFDVAEPLFAPVAAILTLGFSYGERLRRAAEITVGVAIGALIGELFVVTVGMGVWQVTALVAIAMSIAAWLGAGTLMINQAGIQGLVIAMLAGHNASPEGRWFEALIGAVTGMALASLIPSSVLARPHERSAVILERLSELLITSAGGIRTHDTKVAEQSLAAARRMEKDLDTLRGYAADSVDITSYIPWYRSRRDEMQRMQAQLVPIDRAVRNARVLLRRGTIAVQVDEVVPKEYLDSMWDLAQITDLLADYTRHDVEPDDLRPRLWNLTRRTARPAQEADLSAEVIRAQIRSILVDYYMVLGKNAQEAQAVVHSAVDEYMRESEAAIVTLLDSMEPEEHGIAPEDFMITGLLPVLPLPEETNPGGEPPDSPAPEAGTEGEADPGDPGDPGDRGDREGGKGGAGAPGAAPSR